MNTIEIINLILIVILIIIGIETIVKFNKNKNKKVEEIRKPLIIRINIIAILIVII